MSQLEDLLQQCTVKLTLPGRLGWGTGFFVAPGWILTCAHVVQEAGDESVQVRWQKQENWAQATVERLLAAPFDLALLKVTGSTEANPPCVYFDEEIRSRDPLYLFGYPDQDFPNGCPVTFNCEGLTGDESALIKFALGQVRPGMSGSPLLNQRTGKVCGMVKFTRDRSSDLGGGAIPIWVILEQFPELRQLQREFHGRDRRWGDLISKQPKIDFQSYLQAILGNEDYQEWQEVYTPTTVEDRRRMPEHDTAISSQHRFSLRLKLRAETVKPDKTEQNDQRKAQESQERVEQWDVLAGLRNYATEHVVLIGKPGSGKSTSLERLLWEEAEKALQDPNARVPVLVKLRRCTGTIEALIRDFLVGHQVALEIAQVEELLRQGRFLLLLDGLNELPKAFEIEVANFRDRYRRTTPMIVSTRDLGGGGTLGIEKTLKMLPLTEPQMREFVRGYLAEEGDRLFQQLKGDRLRKFAETPLLLWMLCRVSAQNGKVPDNLGLAFREFAQLHDQELQADAPADSKDQWHKLLRHLAFVMMQGKTAIDPELSISREEAEDCLTAYLQQEDRANPRERAEQWLKDLLQYHLIQPVIQPNFEKHVEFHHQLLQEYYAAEYLLKLLPTLTDDQLKQDYLNYLRWTEPIALMLSMLDEEAQALRVVKLAMDEVDLMLGARLAGEVQPVFQATTVGWIDALEIPLLLKCQCWATSQSKVAIAGLLKTIEDQESVVRESAAYALVRLGSETAIPGLLQALEDQDWSVRGSAAEVLGRLGSETAIPGLLKALQDPNYIVRGSAADALVELGSETAIPGLLQALEHPDLDISRSAADALGRLGSEAAIPGLLQALEHPDSDINDLAAFALGRLGSETAIPSLLQALEHPDSYVRWRVADALGHLGSKAAIPILLEVLEHDDSDYVRESAVEVLGRLGSEAAIPGLLQALEDEFLSISGKVADALVRLGSEAAIPGLLQVLDEHHDSYVRGSAADALGRLGSEAAIPGLLRVLNDQDSYVCGRATVALGNLGSEAAIPDLLQALEQSGSGRAADALGRLGSEAAIPGLLQALEDQDPHVRRRAAEALGRLGSETAIPGLLQALEDQDPHVRRSVVFALGNLGSEVAIPSLLRVLNDPDLDVSQRVAFALGNLGSEAAIPGLLQALEDQDPSVRRRAAEALGRLGSETAIPGLLKALKDPEYIVSKQAATAIAKIGSPEPLAALWQRQLVSSDEHIYSAIAAIQNRCQFYNYEIFQAHLATQKADRQTQPASRPNAITIETLERLTIMTDKVPIFNQQHATIGVNYAAEGSKVEFTQHTNSSEQTFEILLTDYQQFIQQLQQKYPTLADATTVPQIIEVEAKLIEAQDQQRWQNFLNLKRLWNGSKKAGIKVSEHFAENNAWAKGAIAFLEGVSEDVK